jgi:hypothetical protein
MTSLFSLFYFALIYFETPSFAVVFTFQERDESIVGSMLHKPGPLRAEIRQSGAEVLIELLPYGRE